MLLKKKKTRYVLFLYMPKRRPKSRSCHRKPLCTRAVLIFVSFKSDEHQYSSSKASATDEPNATLRRVSSLQMTPILPFFEEFLQSQGGLRLDLAHRHPASPVSCQLYQGIKDDVRRTRCPLCPTHPAQVQW